MGTQSLTRAALRLLTGAGMVLLVVSLALLAKTTQNSDDFGRMHVLIVLLNAVGLTLLLSVILVSVARLIRDYRKGVPGARLKARMIAMFVSLAIVPIMLVYLYSMYFLNKGIDSYFNTDVERGLSDALTLSRGALDLRTRDELDALTMMIERTRSWEPDQYLGNIERLRRELHADELTIYGDNGRIIASSTGDQLSIVPRPPPADVLRQARGGEPRVTLEPTSGGGLVAHVVRRMDDGMPDADLRIAHATFDVPPRLNRLARSVQEASEDYASLVFLREPLKDSFKLTLTLVLLVSLLIALWGVFFFARRIVAPIQDLVAGTQAVAEGNFDMRLPEASRDDVGFLVRSFNDMTQRLQSAQDVAQASQNAMATERANLETVLSRLTTGVIALERDLTIRTVNQAAGDILGVDFVNAAGGALAEVAPDRALYQSFVAACREHLDRGEREWREQLVLRGDMGRRILTCACAALPFENPQQPGGYVLVFDDVTMLLQAQRDAAWGEVARRLAHEIKNPLTPIQLSAERLRRRYLETLEPGEAELLERATRTIVGQVESMKAMVDAFRDYARAPDLDVKPLDLHRLIAEVADLYRGRDQRVALRLDLSDEREPIDADAGRVRQLLHNLLRNAMEALASQPDGRIDIRTRVNGPADARYVELVVDDNGPGFAEDVADSLFDPYVTTKTKGTGLGLAIVKKLVEEHAGQVSAGNRPDGGARVTVVLPVNESSRSVALSRGALHAENRRERV
ncbi:MAG: ATP-binding protein [Pseudomonadota bacterium]